MILDRFGKSIELKAKAKQGDGNVQVLVDKMQQLRRIWRKEINDWQYGRMAFYSDKNPTTFHLQEVYQDVMLDDQLTTVTEDRKLRVINNAFVVKNDKGETDEIKTKQLTETEWFYDLVGLAMDSIFYGYNVIWLKQTGGLISEVVEIPRGFVSPHNKLILEQATDPNRGVPIENYPNELIYAQLYSMVGLLEKAAPLTILKRHSWGSWDEFEQIFGIPLRIAKYKSGNLKVKQEIASWLEEMGTAAYGVFPEEADVSIVENSKSDAFNVFLKKIERVDAGLAKLVLHQTMTTDNGSSLSQSEVHERTLENVIKADERKLLLWLNTSLKPIISQLGGYQFGEKDFIAIEKAKDPIKQIDIDSKLMSGGVVLSKDYIEQLYGVEVATVKDGTPPPTEKKKS